MNRLTAPELRNVLALALQPAMLATPQTYGAMLQQTPKHLVEHGVTFQKLDNAFAKLAPFPQWVLEQFYHSFSMEVALRKAQEAQAS